jgi:hypothetical protein
MTKIRSGVFGALVFLVSAVPTASFAEFKPTAAQRSACMGDAMSLCSSVLMNMDRVLSCLSSKKSQLALGAGRNSRPARVPLRKSEGLKPLRTTNWIRRKRRALDDGGTPCCSLRSSV